MGANEAGTVRSLQEPQAVVLRMIKEHGGRGIDTAGDGILALTPSRCAIARLLIPRLFSGSMLRSPFSETRRRPRRHPSSRPTERGHPALRIAPLVAPYGAHRSGERPCDVRLLGESRVHEESNCIGLGVLGAIVMQRQFSDDDHTLIRFHPQVAARIDHHGVR